MPRSRSSLRPAGAVFPWPAISILHDFRDRKRGRKRCRTFSRSNRNAHTPSGRKRSSTFTRIERCLMTTAPEQQMNDDRQGIVQSIWSLRCRMNRKITATLITLVHFLVVLLHGRAHGQLEVSSTPCQLAFIALVIIVSPLIAMAMCCTRLERAGLVLLSISMASSLVFGLMNHFLLAGPDNALRMHDGHWQSIFSTTAIALGLIEVFGFGWPTCALYRISSE